MIRLWWRRWRGTRASVIHGRILRTFSRCIDFRQDVNRRDAETFVQIRGWKCCAIGSCARARSIPNVFRRRRRPSVEFISAHYSFSSLLLLPLLVSFADLRRKVIVVLSRGAKTLISTPDDSGSSLHLSIRRGLWSHRWHLILLGLEQFFFLQMR